jgi:AcrR family transcriptional regulator
MRTVKPPHVRREELLDAAASLIAEQGIEATSVGAIIARAGVAKGTFYWYFSAKEALLEALVERKIDKLAETMAPIVADASRGALDKLRDLFAVHERLRQADPGLRDYFHRPENLALHQKHRQFEQQRLCPLLARVLAQGVAEGCLTTAYP